jgi:hypothetical protein
MNFGRIINNIINIEASANNGFFVTVGCCRLAYSNKEELIADLEEYLDNPKSLEDKYNKLYGGVQRLTINSSSNAGVGSGHLNT